MIVKTLGYKITCKENFLFIISNLSYEIRIKCNTDKEKKCLSQFQKGKVDVPNRPDTMNGSASSAITN
uniref:Uncharacterized protein n=1 Tax=Arundo donax TaxID=35708 RepID=A0A0A9Q9N6_ARUDO